MEQTTATTTTKINNKNRKIFPTKPKKEFKMDWKLWSPLNRVFVPRLLDPDAPGRDTGWQCAGDFPALLRFVSQRRRGRNRNRCVSSILRDG